LYVPFRNTQVPSSHKISGRRFVPEQSGQTHSFLDLMFAETAVHLPAAAVAVAAAFEAFLGVPHSSFGSAPGR
jgi:hypothetical protein